MIEFKNVTKKYGGTTALDRLSITLPDEGICCLLGRNGAGKTTFMKLLAGYVAATEGEITAYGKAVSPGRMPENVSFIENGSAQFNMPLSALIDAAAEMQSGFDKKFALEMVARFELDPKKKFHHLSFGMKTMLATIISLANNTRAVLLDEPVLGFDAIMRNQFNMLLSESYQAHPRLIIVSTHLIDEIAKVTERLIIIDHGKILVETGIEEIDENAYTLSGPAGTVLPLTEGLNCIGKTAMGSMMAAHIYDKRITPPAGVAIDRMSLQDFFINIVGGKSHE